MVRHELAAASKYIKLMFCREYVLAYWPIDPAPPALQLMSMHRKLVSQEREAKEKESNGGPRMGSEVAQRA